VATPDYHITVHAGRRGLLDVHGFRLQQGRITFLFGESGIGKSLLGKTIAGLLPADELTAMINGDSYQRYLATDGMRRIREDGFFVFQEPSTHLNPLMTLHDQMQEGDLRQAPDAIGAVRELWDEDQQHEVDRILPVYPKPYRPSGGEKQRMLLAMALAKIDLVHDRRDGPDTTLFVFDEPTSSLDNAYRDRFLRSLFARYRLRPVTILLITHDYSMISEVSSRHPDLLPHIDFMELAMHGGRHVLGEFRPALYTEWLAGLRSLNVQPPAPRKDELALSVESGVSVNDRAITITREGEQEETAFAVRRGEFVYLKAPSGAGKTTLVKTIMGLTRPKKFRMRLGPTVITERTPRSAWQNDVWGRKLTMVFQHADEALNPRATVRESFLGLPLPRAEITRRLEPLLADLFDPDVLSQIVDKQVRHLSGGQKQRVNLLRSLLLDTEYLILDEPLNGLDFDSFRAILANLQRKAAGGTGIILISHNEEIFDRLIPRQSRYHLHAVRAEESK
jgi:peptide/nickel transport system ATP-binding protein